MNRNLETIARAAARECERQHVDEDALVRLLQAHLLAVSAPNPRPTLTQVRQMATLIEPTLNPADAPFRRTPVTFANGDAGVDHTVILDVLAVMWRVLDADTDAHDFTRDFLGVHPLRDGNGRLAWLIFNWLEGTLGDPLALPDFFDEAA